LPFHSRAIPLQQDLGTFALQLVTAIIFVTALGRSTIVGKSYIFLSLSFLFVTDTLISQKAQRRPSKLFQWLGPRSYI